MSITFNTSYLQYFAYVIIGIAAFFLLFFLVKKIASLIRRPELYGMSREQIKKQWEQIEELLNRKEETAWKLAIMEADKLLDHSLKSMATPGLNLGERLRFMGHKYPKLRLVWDAHKIRNKLAHEAGYRLSHSMAKRAIKDFKNALEELNVL